MKLKIGLYGTNGHQITRQLRDHPRAELAATACFPASARKQLDVPHYDSLDAMLDDERVQLVSLCSPRRRDQARETVRCLGAGKHAYAEKPCALTEEDLDAMRAAAAEARLEFHEMAGTAFVQPYLAMRDLVRAGTIGTVVQVLTQKSYPYHNRRPQDENVDGGLLCQAGIHAFRFIEHVACQPIAEVKAFETQLGNPGTGELRMAASYMMHLENGGLASMVANYLNQPGFGSWGNETLRVFGTLGFVEAVDGGARTRLVVGKEDRGKLDLSARGRDYFDFVVDKILDGTPMPLTLDEELHPARMIIRAKTSAMAGGA